MRIFRSSMKTSRMTPLSSPFLPIRHAWARRIEKSSMLSPSSERKTATTTWFEAPRSRWINFCSSRSPSAGRTRAEDALELHLGRLLATGRGLEEGLLLEAAEGGDHAAGIKLEPRVVVAHRLVEAHALHRDPVLGALELALQLEEVLVGLELGIALDGDEEPAQRAAQLGLRLLELLERRRIVDQLGRRLDPGHAGPRPGHFLEHGAFLRGEALDRLDQVRDQVGATLVDVLDLRPLLVDELLAAHELVVDADRPDQTTDDDDGDDQEDQESGSHGDDYTSAGSAGATYSRAGAVEGAVEAPTTDRCPST